MKRHLITLVLFAALLFGCVQQNAPPQNGELPVVNSEPQDDLPLDIENLTVDDNGFDVADDASDIAAVDITDEEINETLG